MKKAGQKLNIRIKINIAIFGILTMLFAAMPTIMMYVWYPDDNDEPQYVGGFAYITYDICPCSADEEDCKGYYACGPDKANITYDLDTAPEDLLAKARRDQYFETLIEGNRRGVIVIRQYLLCDICYLMSFVSLVGGVIYWNHNKARE